MGARLDADASRWCEACMFVHRHRLALTGACLAALLLAVSLTALKAGGPATARAMVAAPPDQAAAHPAYVHLARAAAPALYAAHCASCHGGALQGSVALGAPNLTDGVHLFGTGRVTDIERTILYGIRAGGRARNVAEMPALGAAGLLSPTEIASLVSFIRQQNHHPADASDADAGRALYAGKGGCADCHGADAAGNSDYGAPSLVSGVFDNGGTSAQLTDSLYYGRHDVCPGFRTVLTPLQIRELALYLYLAAPHGA